MFEKEAEEFAIGHEYEYDDIGVAREALCQGYLVGAEFGYNKAFVEADKNLKATVTDFNKAGKLVDKKTALKKRILELEKESDELKEQCLILADCDTCHSTCKNENIEMKKQLTKAKEIIRDLLHVLPKENIEGIYEVTEAAEQFISEVGE